MIIFDMGGRGGLNPTLIMIPLKIYQMIIFKSGTTNFQISANNITN